MSTIWVRRVQYEREMNAKRAHIALIFKSRAHIALMTMQRTHIAIILHYIRTYAALIVLIYHSYSAHIALTTFGRAHIPTTHYILIALI